MTTAGSPAGALAELGAGVPAGVVVGVDVDEGAGAFIASLGPEGVAYVSGRRRNGGKLSREAFESDLRREGFEVINGGQKPNHSEEPHAHGFDVRIMVLSGEITVMRNGGSETFHAGDHCEILGDCQHCTQVGPEGVAYIVGKVERQPSYN